MGRAIGLAWNPKGYKLIGADGGRQAKNNQRNIQRLRRAAKCEPGDYSVREDQW